MLRPRVLVRSEARTLARSHAQQTSALPTELTKIGERLWGLSGRGGVGWLQPSQNLGKSVFWGSMRKLGKF